MFKAKEKWALGQLLCVRMVQKLFCFLIFTLEIQVLSRLFVFFLHWRTNSIMTVQVKADEFRVELLFLQNVLSSLYLANIYLTPLLTNSWKRIFAVQHLLLSPFR